MKKILFGVVILAILFCGASAQAALVECGGTGDPCDICDLFTIINTIISVVIKGIVPLGAALIIAYAGFKMLMNQGNAEVTNQVRQIIIGTVVGLVVVYTSYDLVGLMLSSMGYVKYTRGTGAGVVATPFNWAPKCEY